MASPDQTAWTRRGFLAASLRVAGSVAVAPAVLAACARGAGSAAGLAVFDDAQRAVLDAVLDAFVPSGGAFALGASDVQLGARVQRFVAAQPPDVAVAVRGALFAVEWLSPVLAGRLGRFSALDATGREACLRALVGSRSALARDLYAGLKQLSIFSFYSVDQTWVHVGYEGPWVRRAERET
jgi:hypothetical protein